MCPACIHTYVTTATVIGGIASSSGGIVAVVLTKLKKITVKEKCDGIEKSRVES